jgi:sugar phosphate isomerase/epimerase
MGDRGCFTLDQSETRSEKRREQFRLGIRAHAWCSQWNNDTLGLIDEVKDLGMDFIEIPLMRLDTFDPKAIKERLDRSGLGVVTSTVLLGDTDITGDDEKTRKKGIEYLKDCVKATGDIGANSFSGVICSQHVKQALESFVDISETMHTWVWRQLAPGGDALLKERSEFIRKMMKKYGLS